MEFAALVSFAILLVAWIVAPDAPRRPEVEMPAPDAREAHEAPDATEPIAA